MRADLGHIDGLLASLRALVNAVADDRRALIASMDVFERWHSEASDSFYEGHFAPRARNLFALTEDVEGLVDILTRTRTAIEAQVQAARGHEQRIRQWFDSQPLPEDGSPPRWEAEGWRYRPGRFPVSGDSEWFAAADYLRIS